MKKIIGFLIIGFWSITSWGQTLETGKKIEYSLPNQNCDTGKFYLGKFGIGTYEISCNIAGYDANNCGWKIIVGRNYGKTISMNELYNNLGGKFYFQNDGSTGFHLWWHSNYKKLNTPKEWCPHLKVNFQIGSIDITNPNTPNANDAIELKSIINQRTPNIIVSELTVEGKIKAEEIIVQEILAANSITVKANGQTADFVFADSYQLKELSEVETFIKKNNHLPDIPSASQMEEQGVNLAEMNKLLLQKVEELTIYAIQQDEKLKQKDKQVADLIIKSNMEIQKRKELDKRLAKIEALLIKD